MAKDIKAIACPKCGSVFKQELKPDFYKCQHCGTEYYLDSDDVHIYHHHQQFPPLQSSAPAGNNKLPVYIILGVITVMIATYLISIALQPKTKNGYQNSISTYKVPRVNFSSFVYANTLNGDPIYLRLGTDYISHGNEKSEQELHAQFNNASNGKLIDDKIIADEGLRDDRCALTFKTYSPELIYGIGCNTRLFKLDAQKNQLKDVTKATFKDYPQLGSGVARLEFDYDSDMIIVMSNEGNSYYYFPTLHKLVGSKAQADAVWKGEFDRHYFEFGYVGDFFDNDKVDQLVKINYSKITGQTQRSNLTPGRKYFAPKILYQDENNLLIVVNTTLAESSPVTIQSIDVRSGEIKWALPPDRYELYSSSKCKQGFAVEYRKDEEADYVHGVLVISNTGQLVYNYQLGRTE